MRRARFSKPSPAMVVALLALFVALGGTGYAALKLPKNSVGTKQLKKNAVTGAKVKNRSLTGADIKAGSLGTVPSARHADSAAHANSADQAPPVGAAGGALGGTYPNPSLACPPGTTRHGDSCSEASDRPAANWETAIDTCTAAGRRLGTPAEVFALATREMVGGWTSTAYTDSIGPGEPSSLVTVIHIDEGPPASPVVTSQPPIQSSESYRCFANLGGQ